MSAIVETAPEVVYPDSDGKPMADNTVQYRWMQTIEGNLSILFRDREDVFVAGDHLIYAVKGRPKKRRAPDVYAVFGRPKGDRGSYKVWEEGGLFPQVVFEILSPKNHVMEMVRKVKFYECFGAEEYYEYDPDANVLKGCLRKGARLADVKDMHNYVSPRLGIRFDLSGPELVIYSPNGERFLTFVELGEKAERDERRAEQEHQRAERADKKAEQEHQRAERADKKAEQERQRAEQERQKAEQEQQRAERADKKAEQERQRAEQERQRAEQERQRADQMAVKFRELGLDPEAILNGGSNT